MINSLVYIVCIVISFLSFGCGWFLPTWWVFQPTPGRSSMIFPSAMISIRLPISEIRLPCLVRRCPRQIRFVSQWIWSMSTSIYLVISWDFWVIWTNFATENHPIGAIIGFSDLKAPESAHHRAIPLLRGSLTMPSNFCPGNKKYQESHEVSWSAQSNLQWLRFKCLCLTLWCTFLYT
jgi:hypothetical protein